MANPPMCETGTTVAGTQAASSNPLVDQALGSSRASSPSTGTPSIPDASNEDQAVDRVVRQVSSETSSPSASRASKTSSASVPAGPLPTAGCQNEFARP